MKKSMQKNILLVVVLSLLGINAVGADEVYKANPEPPTDGLVGANYTAAYAVNQVQFWHDFREDVIEKEMAAALNHIQQNPTNQIELPTLSKLEYRPVTFSFFS